MTQTNGHALYIDGGMVLQRLTAGRHPVGMGPTVTTRVVCLEGEEMAMVWDREIGQAMKFGTRADIDAYATVLRKAMRAAGAELPGADLSEDDIRLTAFSATQEAVEALLDCWGRAGAATGFAAAFGQEDGPPPPGPRH